MPQKVWTVGEEVLAADFNTYVQNQVVPVFPNTAGRDTWAAPPNGALAITVDTNTIWQRVNGVWVSVVAKSRFRVTGGGAGQLANSGVNVPCTWVNGSEAYDTDNAIAIGSGIFTCPAAWPGRWRFDYAVSWSASATGIRASWLEHSAGNVRYAKFSHSGATTGTTEFSGSSDIVLTGGQTVLVNTFHTVGSAATINSTVNEHFQGRYVGPV